MIEGWKGQTCYGTQTTVFTIQDTELGTIQMTVPTPEWEEFLNRLPVSPGPDRNKTLEAFLVHKLRKRLKQTTYPNLKPYHGANEHLPKGWTLIDTSEPVINNLKMCRIRIQGPRREIVGGTAYGQPITWQTVDGEMFDITGLNWSVAMEEAVAVAKANTPIEPPKPKCSKCRAELTEAYILTGMNGPETNKQTKVQVCPNGHWEKAK
jgi:hypothetical protein